MYVCYVIFVYACVNISNIFMSISARMQDPIPCSWYQSYSLVLEGCLCDCRITLGPGNRIYLVEVVDIHKGYYQTIEC